MLLEIKSRVWCMPRKYSTNMDLYTQSIQLFLPLAGQDKVAYSSSSPEASTRANIKLTVTTPNPKLEHNFLCLYFWDCLWDFNMYSVEKEWSNIRLESSHLIFNENLGLSAFNRASEIQRVQLIYWQSHSQWVIGWAFNLVNSTPNLSVLMCNKNIILSSSFNGTVVHDAS